MNEHSFGVNPREKDEELSEATKIRRCKSSDNDLDDLREYIDSVSFNLGKAYRHAKDRSKKQSQRSLMRRKNQHPYTNAEKV